MSTNLAIIVADFTTSLATGIGIGGTTATLSSATDDDSVALPSGRYFFSLDNGNASKEHVSCDLVGTAISNIVSISRQGVLTTGVVRSHRLGATVTITNFAHILYQNNLLNGTDLYDASTPIEYDGSATITGNNQLTTLEKVLTLVNGGTVSIDQTVIAARAGETVASGESLYQSEADGEWYKTDASDIAKSVNVNLGIAQGAGTDGDAIAGGVLIAGLDKTQTYTAGAIYYLSNTPGDLATSAGTNSVIVGVGDANNRLVWVNIYDRDAVTPDEKAALTGTTGTPSSTNKYVTDDNVYSDEFDQEQTTQDGAIATGRANATGENNRIAQSFTAGRTKIRGAVLWKEPSTGTNAGNITFSLQADTAGNPSGVSLATVTLSAAVYNLLSNDALFEVAFTAEYAGMTQGSLYWIVVSSSTSDNSNHINLGTNIAGGYANGSAKRNNTTDGWVAVATVDLYFKTINGTIGQIFEKATPKVFNTSGIWVNPKSNSQILVQMWGGGGSGGRGTGGGGGGGGGAYNEFIFNSADLGDSEIISVGQGGEARTSNGLIGEAGGNSSFGTLIYAYGGGGGGQGTGANDGGGGGGGSFLGIGGQGGATAAGAVGSNPFLLVGYFAGGQRASGTTDEVNGLYSSGGGSGFTNTLYSKAGNSYYGGGGGGGTGTSLVAGTSVLGGAGGTGNATDGTQNGTSPAGGGGGNKNSENSGSGGNGKVIITIL